MTVLDVRGRMRREVRMHRGRMVIVVIRIDVRVQERRAHGTALNRERQTERQQAADHRAILSQKAGDFTRSGAARSDRVWP